MPDRVHRRARRPIHAADSSAARPPTATYAFDAANSGNTVLVANVNPLAGVVSGTTFSVGADRYRLNVDKNGDFDAADALDDERDEAEALLAAAEAG